MKKTSALVLLSGGQDSTTALCWALEKFNKVSTITFNFGQTHAIELESAKNIAESLHVYFRVIELKDIYHKTPHCSLLSEADDKQASEKFPATFVPGRNLLFLNVAAIHAFSEGIRDLVIGVSEVDFSGYPDCREGFILSAEKTISLALDEKFKIHTPFIHMSKSEEVLLMKKLGKLDLLEKTHTCYKGQRPPCGACDACILRAKAFQEAGIPDPIL